MKKFTQSFKAFIADEHGATAIEYGLLASLIAVAIIGGATAVGGKLDDLFEGVADKLVVPA
jgi:pilus assembly protein Flp/PilA